jgi:hypothetical protein
MRTKPYTVLQNGKPIFTVYARSLEAARAIVAAKVAGEVIVVAVSIKPAVSAAFNGAAQ